MKTVTVIEMQTRLCELQAQQGIEVTQVTYQEKPVVAVLTSKRYQAPQTNISSPAIEVAREAISQAQRLFNSYSNRLVEEPTLDDFVLPITAARNHLLKGRNPDWPQSTPTGAQFPSGIAAVATLTKEVGSSTSPSWWSALASRSGSLGEPASSETVYNTQSFDLLFVSTPGGDYRIQWKKFCEEEGQISTTLILGKKV